MEKEMTKVECFAVVRKIVEGAETDSKAELLQFIDREVELLNNKKSSSKETKGKKVNNSIMSDIVTVLTELGKPVTITELLEDNRLSSYTDDKEITVKMSSQKLSALVKKLVEAGSVVKTTDKKKSYFSVVSPAESKEE